ncbi:hypothetical protein C8R44DRAFT_641240 [Mycena epipterygia]|nr:hypothetical protein C8R44DRAFT_641240 [Mycena epipterygia]
MSASRCSECSAVASGGAPAEYPVDVDTAPGTRHHRLLNSNEAPLDSDTPIVRSAISKARARLTVVEDELSRLRELMKSLEKEHAALSDNLAHNNSILSPLRRMPPEVLGEIFSWTLPSVGVLQEGHLGVAVSPWVLTHISSHWRAVSLSTTSLWSLVVVEFRHESPYHLPMV